MTSAVLVVLSILLVVRRRGLSLRGARRALIIVGSAGAGIAIVLMLFLPKTAVRLERVFFLVMRSDLHSLSMLIKAESATNSPLTISDLRFAYTRATNEVPSDYFLNAFIGGHIREEDSPGNFTLRESADGIEYVVYDAAGGAEVMHVFVADDD